jgi:hypothetical protein
LPLYYSSEKEDFRGLVTYLKGQIRDGDKVFVGSGGYMVGILHYFGVFPEDRHYFFPLSKDPQKGIQFSVPLIYQNRTFTLYHSQTCCTQYVADGNRLWIIVGKLNAVRLKKYSPFVLKGYFDGSFLNYIKFPTDASLYLFLWDPKAPNEKGIDISIE